MAVDARPNRFLIVYEGLGGASLLLSERQRAQYRLLLGDEGVDAFAGEGEHFVELAVVEGSVLGGGLHLDHLAAGGHDEVHIDIGARVFFIAEVEEGLTVDDADTDGGDEVA